VFDGFTEKLDDDLKQKMREKHIRIFSYAVGPHPLPVTALKEMACDTNGSYTLITAMGAIRTQIQGSYVDIISRPLVLSKEHPIEFSSIYLNAIGLGFTSTMTLPVFNTSVSADNDNQTLVGIVGIDIPISRFETFAPREQLGPLGYSFGVNTNGFLIFHPSLDYLVQNYLEDPSHNDFTEIEGDTDSLTACDV
jgi:voltage-dependent calcium channel alpha-2/delta-1/voltage-dependent calcium channel alpha-2/delta-2